MVRASRSGALMWTAGLSLSVVLLGGCGGGGGTGSDPDLLSDFLNAAKSEPTVVLDEQNAKDASSSAMTLATVLLSLGEFTTRTIEAALADWQDNGIACAGYSESSRVLRISDVDGNGRPDTGDSIEVSLQNCGDLVLGDTGTGLFDVRLEALDTRGPEPLFTATVRMREGFYIGGGYERTYVEGSFTVQRAGASLVRSTRLTATDANDLTFGYLVNGGRIRMPVQTPDVTRSFDYRRALQSASLNTTLTAPGIGGSVRLETLAPISSPFNTLPEQGSLRIIGANDTDVVWSAPDSASAGMADGILHGRPETGSARESRLSMDWRALAPDFLWTEPLGLLASMSSGQPLYTDGDSPLTLLFVNQPVRTDGLPELTLQFSKPVGQATGIAFAFVDADDDRQPPIAAQLTYEGARVYAKPAQTLPVGKRYHLADVSGTFVSRIYRAWNDPPYPLIEVVPSVSARAAASRHHVSRNEVFELNGEQSTAFEGRVERFRWKQIQGPTAAIANPGTARTSVTPSLSSNPIDKLVFELTVEDSAGRVSHDTTVVHVISNPEIAAYAVFSEVSAPGRQAVQPTPNGALWAVDAGSLLRYAYTSAPEHLGILLNERSILAQPGTLSGVSFRLTTHDGSTPTFSDATATQFAFPPGDYRMPVGWTTSRSDNHIVDFSPRFNGNGSYVVGCDVLQARAHVH